MLTCAPCVVCRVGLLLISGAEEHSDARQHAGTALVRVFKYIQDKEGGRSALRWLAEVRTGVAVERAC